MLKIGNFPQVGKGMAGSVLTRCMREAVLALLAIPLLMLLVLVLLRYGGHLAEVIGSRGAYSAYALAMLLAGVVGLLFFAVLRRRQPFRPAWFLACSLTFSAIVYYAYISSIKVAWISDFQTMWVYAVNMVSSGNYSVQSIYNERALPVLVPSILMFGPNPAVIPFVNLVLLLGVQLLGYDLMRRIAGHCAAQGFAILWIGAMEPIFALPITSHDIWGLFFLMLFVWGFRATLDWKSGRERLTHGDIAILATYALALAAVLTLLDMQRELTPFVILGYALGGLLLLLKGGNYLRLRPAFLLAGVVFVLYGGISAGLKHSGYMLTAEQGRTLAHIRIGAYGSSLSNGSYGQGQVIQNTFLNQVNGDARQDLVYAIPLSDLALQPVARLGNIVHRVHGQAALGSQTYFYQAQAKTRWPWLLPLTHAYNVCYSILLAALGLWLVLPLLRRMDTLDGMAQLSLLSILVGILVLAGESQPRYIFPLWLILPQAVAIALARGSGVVEGDVPVTSVLGWDLMRGALLLLLGYFLFAVAVKGIYRESHGRVLSGWRPALHGGLAPEPEKWFRENQNVSAAKIKLEGNDNRAVGFGDLALVMKVPVDVTPGGGVSAEKMLCVGEERRALEFFYYMPYQNPRAEGAFTLELLVDNQIRWRTALPGTTTVQHIRIPDILPTNACGKVKFNLRANRGLPRPSWITASQTEIYFPRLSR